MDKIFQLIETLIKNGVVPLLMKVADLGKDVMKFLNLIKEQQIEKEQKEQKKKEHDKIDEVCDKGTIKDLINLGVDDV